MVVDSSALLAIVLAEPDEPEFSRALANSAKLHMSVATWVEAGIVAMRSGGAALLAKLDHVVAESAIAIEPLTVAQAELARVAYQRYGRTFHKANLNFGDCFTYALAKSMDQPILCKGNDFALTDVSVVDLAQYR